MSQFECTKHHSKCKAMCCQVVPIEQEVYLRNQHKIVTEPKSIMPFEGNDPLENRKILMVIPLTEDGYCPFLNKDLTCNIYEDRPSVCQKYGTERHPTLRCPYQDKNGRTRSRQETRKILRDAEKGAEKLFQLPRRNGQ